MARTDAKTLIAWRLAAHGLADAHETPTDAVRRLLAVQAQDPQAAAWALAVRTADATRADVDAAFAAGEVVRSWPLRGTLQFVAAEDLRWLLALTAERQLRAQERRRAGLGLDDAQIERAREAAVALLAGGKQATRAELLAAFDAAGVATGSGRGYHLILHLSQSGTLVWGPGDEKSQLLVLLDEDEALARLVNRYLAGHGPATAPDLAWWSALPVGAIRRGAAAAGGAVSTVEHDGTAYLVLTEQTDAPPPRIPPVLLLPGFDEYLLGYQNRDLVLPREHAARIVPGANGVFRPTLVLRGRVAATWRAKTGRKGTTIEVEAFETLATSVSLDGAARRYGRFLGTTATVA